MSYPAIRNDINFRSSRTRATAVPCDWCHETGKVQVPAAVKGEMQEEDCWKCDGHGMIEVGR